MDCRSPAPRASVKAIGPCSACEPRVFPHLNVKRIKPAVFMPYDLTRENLTAQLWAFEGVTSYYDDLTLLRGGVIGVRDYLEITWPRHHAIAPHTRTLEAKRCRVELRCVDQVIPSGREHAPTPLSAITSKVP